MGETIQSFCDGCKKAITPATFSQGGETGVVALRISIWKTTGSQVEGVSGDLCQTCYDKLMTWFRNKKTAAATEWGIDAPAVKVLVPPTL